MSRLPPDVSKAVTSCRVRVRIDAPVSTVWKVILDFPSYPLWNTFVRTQAITDSSFKPLLAHPQPKAGDHLLMHVRMPPRGLDDNDKNLRATKEMITLVDEANHRIAWGQCGIPGWLLRAERWQELTEEQVEGRTYTNYMTVEVFNGPAAWVVRWFLHRNLMTSFEAMAKGLKKRSEELAAEARTP